MTNAQPQGETRAAPTRQLTLFDSTSIIVGIIIGAGIYESTPRVAGNVADLTTLVGVWLLGGLLSLVGALCYVELGNAYPKQGGDYVYLTRAFGRNVGFLFAWVQLWVVRPGSIGAMAYVFAHYAYHLVPIPGLSKPAGWMLYAAGSIAVLSLVNILGVREGKWTQNILSTAKVLGLAAVAVVGLFFARPEPVAAAAAAAAAEPVVNSLDSFGLAMIFVLFAYGGWNEMAYVAAEVRNPRRNMLRAMLLGTLAVAAVYIVVNLAFVQALGLDGLRGAEAPAGKVLALGRLGDWGDRFISVLICVSALGAVNGQIFTGARIYYAMGAEHSLFAPLGRWHPRLGTPVGSLVIQAVITLATVLIFGLIAGDRLTKPGFGSGFESMVIFTGPLFWGFLVLVALSVFVLRWREPDTPRPYRVWLYPATPIVFAAFSLYMTYRSTTYAAMMFSAEAWWALGALALGVAAMCFNRPRKPEPDAPHTAPP